jgi:uncharacterized protein
MRFIPARAGNGGAARAADLYRQACDAGDGLGCYDLAAHYLDGNGVPRDREKGTALLRQATTT